MQLSIQVRVALGVALSLIASAAVADKVDLSNLLTEIESDFSGRLTGDEVILDAAKNLFAALATISLVWTMGLLILRQDIGEVVMELLRFMVVTGTLYWLLINASDHAGGEDFVQRIVGSFYQLDPGGSKAAFLTGGNGAMRRALHVYLRVIEDTSQGDEGDRIVGGVMGIIVLIALTLLAAQFLLALVMAWFLGYGGIFLLGFGGSRWTSQIAINYYKHVVALGISILALGIIGAVSESVFGRITPASSLRAELPYGSLGEILVVSVLMLVLGLRVPQLLYTLVTGSSLGMFAGTAGMVGSAIATGGGAAFAAVGGRTPAAEGGGAPVGSVARTSSAMEAIERSAVSVGGMADPFNVNGGSDPFGVPRKPDPYRSSTGGSVFGSTGGQGAAARLASSSAQAATEDRSHSSDYGHPSAQVDPGAYAHVDTASQPSSRSDDSQDTGVSTAGLQDVKKVYDTSRPDYLEEMSAITAAWGEDGRQHPALIGRGAAAHESLQADVTSAISRPSDVAAADATHSFQDATQSATHASGDIYSGQRMEATGHEASILNSSASGDTAAASGVTANEVGSLELTTAVPPADGSPQMVVRVEDDPIGASTDLSQFIGTPSVGVGITGHASAIALAAGHIVGSPEGAVAGEHDAPVQVDARLDNPGVDSSPQLPLVLGQEPTVPQGPDAHPLQVASTDSSAPPPQFGDAKTTIEDIESSRVYAESEAVAQVTLEIVRTKADVAASPAPPEAAALPPGNGEPDEGRSP
ncbi:P-type conjugative transfer protein TrbL [Luteibacter sp. dw_328]|uniref:P-type conjugative transfer protein TrbL n=1 Tax=Luteibacter sp. dw_328 TaxID=2719796 RepID=UPI001BD304D3|nr:P-type conjugative transfer protein TrbL [Luteibacter sp. dw_328]